jgi:hypothetical protein
LPIPEVGDLDLSYQTLLFPDDPRTSLIIFTFQAASPTEERYRLPRSLHASGGGHTGVHADGAFARLSTNASADTAEPEAVEQY